VRLTPLHLIPVLSSSLDHPLFIVSNACLGDLAFQPAAAAISLAGVYIVFSVDFFVMRWLRSRGERRRAALAVSTADGPMRLIGSEAEAYVAPTRLELKSRITRPDLFRSNEQGERETDRLGSFARRRSRSWRHRLLVESSSIRCLHPRSWNDLSLVCPAPSRSELRML